MGMTGASNNTPDGPATRLNDMNALLAQNWWAFTLRGIIGVLFGLVAFFLPGTVMLSLALLFGIYLVVDGIFGIISAIRAARRRERWGLLLVEGILNIIMGVIALLFPVAAVLLFVFVTAAWALLTGGLMLGSAFSLHASHGRWWLAFGGIVSLLWGIALVIAPLIGAIVLTWWLGVYAIVFGIMLLMLSFQLRSQRATPHWEGLTRGA